MAKTAHFHTTFPRDRTWYGCPYACACYASSSSSCTTLHHHHQVCKYYLRGACSFGAQCRYDHIRPERLGRGLEPAPRAGGPSSSYIPPPDAPAVPSTSTWTATAAGGGGGGGGNDQQHEDQYVDNGEHEAEHDEEAVVNAMHAMRLATQHDDLLATLPDTIDDDDDVFYHGDSAYTHQEYGEYEHGALTNNIPVNPWENNTHGASTTAEGSVWGGPLPAHLKATPTSSSSPPSVLPPSAVNRIPAAALHGLCPEWFVAGRCQRGGACTLVHGNQCEVCVFSVGMVSSGCCCFECVFV